MITFKCSEEVEMARVSTTLYFKVSIGCFEEVNFLQIFMFLIYNISFQDTESLLCLSNTTGSSVRSNCAPLFQQINSFKVIVRLKKIFQFCF